MLFNSYQFLLVFLPITLLIYFGLSNLVNKKISILIILISSLIFYSRHEHLYLLLFLFSITSNYLFSKQIHRLNRSKNNKLSLSFLKYSILFNLIILFIFKYFNFFVESIYLLGFSIPKLNLILPIGISFYTFQQIGYLVDVFRKKTEGTTFIEYATFVSFFPQLIAGPIVLHSDFINQIRSKKFNQRKENFFSIGLIIFLIGLFKKIMIADTLSSKFVKPFYDYILTGNIVSIPNAWIGTLSYSIQIYFDFSAYSEMAIGLGLIFGLTLPVNFNSPFQSNSLIEFWERWNITLSRFIGDYIYQPIFRFLSRDNSNFFSNHIYSILISMTISGLWHGANWNFILWGLIHGVALALNHFFKAKRFFISTPIFLKRLTLLTFLNITFVIFKNSNMDLMNKTIYYLFPLDRIFKLSSWNFNNIMSLNFISYLFFILLILIILFTPSTLKTLGYISRNYEILEIKSLFSKYKFNLMTLIFLTTILSVSFSLCLIFLHREAEFIYFQF